MSMMYVKNIWIHQLILKQNNVLEKSELERTFIIRCPTLSVKQAGGFTVGVSECHFSTAARLLQRIASPCKLVNRWIVRPHPWRF